MTVRVTLTWKREMNRKFLPGYLKQKGFLADGGIIISQRIWFMA